MGRLSQEDSHPTLPRQNKQTNLLKLYKENYFKSLLTSSQLTTFQNALM